MLCFPARGKWSALLSAFCSWSRARMWQECINTFLCRWANVLMVYGGGGHTHHYYPVVNNILSRMWELFNLGNQIKALCSKFGDVPQKRHIINACSCKKPTIHSTVLPQVVDSLRKENNSHFAKLQAYPSTTQRKQFKLGRDKEEVTLSLKYFVYLGQNNK